MIVLVMVLLFINERYCNHLSEKNNIGSYGYEVERENAVDTAGSRSSRSSGSYFLFIDWLLFFPLLVSSSR